jgi:hypothetical protein
MSYEIRPIVVLPDGSCIACESAEAARAVALESGQSATVEWALYARNARTGEALWIIDAPTQGDAGTVYANITGNQPPPITGQAIYGLSHDSP